MSMDISIHAPRVGGGVVHPRPVMQPLLKSLRAFSNIMSIAKKPASVFLSVAKVNKKRSCCKSSLRIHFSSPRGASMAGSRLVK